MLPLIAALALAPVQVVYQFPSDKPRIFDVHVNFQGFIPLFGGQDGKVDVNMTVSSRGEMAGMDTPMRASCELKDVKVLYNDTAMPFGLDAVTKFFPKTFVNLNGLGHITKIEGVGEQPPVNLPGLDVHRFPDITFVPIEFPAEGVEEGKSWQFKKTFNGSDVTYDVTATKVADAEVDMDIRVSQTGDYLENAGLQVVTDEKDAEAKVHSVLTGTGHAVFDRSLGAIQSADIEASVDSVTTNLHTKEQTDHKLNTKLEIKLAQ